MTSPAMAAFWFGILSAVSLPLGAWVGILSRPSERVTAGVMAYGAGALLAALTLELVNEALEKLHGGFWPLGLGCVLGALIFVTLNQALNNHGGFLRKTATLIKHAASLKRKRVDGLIDRLSRVPMFNTLPPEEIHAVVSHIKERTFKPGVSIVNEGEPGYELYILEEGRAKVVQKGRKIADLGSGEVFGEMAVLKDNVRQATVVAETDVKLLEIHKQDLERLLKASPELSERMTSLYELRRQNLDEAQKAVDATEWADEAKGSLDSSVYQPTPTDLREVIVQAKARGGAPMAIWLGIFLDGIPESAVIGANMVGGAKVSMALIAGLFLANFPESMSSAVGLKKMGKSNLQITLLWGSLCILTGIGAYIGNLTFQNASVTSLTLFEGLAAGAMLAMISETMLPEAYEQGGAIVGMSTVLGFLSAVLVKTFH